MDKVNINEIMTYAHIKGMLISPEIKDKLCNLDYKLIIDSASKTGIFVLDDKYLLSFCNEVDCKNNDLINVNSNKTELVNDYPNEIIKTRYIYAKDIEPDLKICHDTDITNNSSTSGKVNQFYDYFCERYRFLSGMLKKHTNINPVESKSLKRLNKNDEVILIGMLIEKSVTKNGNILLTFDDLDGTFKVVVTQKDNKLTDIAKNLIDDDVIAIKGTKLSDDIIIAKELEFPDLANKTLNKANRDVYAISISDIHVGSKLFFDNEFNKFIDWLSMKNISDNDFDVVSRIKYLFIAGDIVDGVGVYPQQINELNVFDIYEQYDILAKYLDKIPEHIEIVIGPGNHDSVRLADPQPAISKDFAKPLHQIKNISMVGSPVSCKVEGLDLLMYHGNSMPYLQTALSLDFERADLAMIEYLKRRDLATMYGSRHPVLPEKGCYMLIKNEPDIFITGHIHVNAYNYYKNTLLINSGTWQAQSVYQKEQGHNPTPCKVPIIKLNENKVQEKVFLNESSKM